MKPRKEEQMEFSIKRASIEDAEKVSVLFDAYRVFYKQDSDLPLANKYISDRINNDESVIFFAQDENGNYLGFTQLYPSFSSVSAKPIWILYDLFVAESARRKGVAKQLMNKAKEHALETNAESLILETAIDNYNAQALYEMLGYERDNEFYSYYLELP